MGKVLCFGELLMRLSPQLGGSWISQNSMPVFIGGAELNTATALAAWKIPVAYCTALPDHHLTKEVIDFIRSKGIDPGKIQLRGNRIGIYYLPQGTDLKGAGVIYDRAHSSFWNLEPGQLDWDEILKDVEWFCWSAISPALNANVAAVCKEGVEAASKKGITICVDLNYRAKLWQYGTAPHEVMPELVQHCDVIMGNIWAEEKMLGIPVSKNLGNSKGEYIDQSSQSSEQLTAAFPKCKQVANTFRFDGDKGLNYYTTLYSGNQLFTSAEYNTETVLDRVGSGDTFMAGLIYGAYHGHAPQTIIEFATAAAFNKLFIKGDASTATVEQIKKRI
jgi:2-dehydro-3-deoxygluconokinase